MVKLNITNIKTSFWSSPLIDYERLLQLASQGFTWFKLLLLMTCAVIGWWLYVPIHELLHAFGCLLTGGEVTRLELSPEYGAAWLQKLFPWIAIGSDYAGQLTGFDTNQNDWCYLVTVLLPFLLSVFPGMFMLRHALTDHWENTRPWIICGFSAPMVIAPFISIIGDMYEAASILISRLANTINPFIEIERWRSDDLPQLIQTLWPEMNWSDALGVLASSLLAICLCWSIYYLGRCIALQLTLQNQANKINETDTN